VLWTDIEQAAIILRQMQELGMKQRVFGSHRTIGDELIKLAGSAAENFEAVYPFDPSRTNPHWLDFVARYQARYHETPDHFAALAYDQMRILLDAICRAGLNKGRIRDALTGLTTYKGVTGDMVFDPNCKNIAPLFLAHVQSEKITYRRITMDKPYARVGEDDVHYSGPSTAKQNPESLRIGIFGPHADELIQLPEVQRNLEQWNAAGERYSLVAIPTGTSWGKASSDLVKAVYDQHALALIALDRPSSHLAEQIAVKAFLPVMAISSDRTLTSTNIPWIFRFPDQATLGNVLACLAEAIQEAGPSRSAIRDILASGRMIAGIRFNSTGEPAHQGD
jgi:hypothetical protein